MDVERINRQAVRDSGSAAVGRRAAASPAFISRSRRFPVAVLALCGCAWVVSVALERGFTVGMAFGAEPAPAAPQAADVQDKGVYSTPEVRAQFEAAEKAVGDGDLNQAVRLYSELAESKEAEAKETWFAQHRLSQILLRLGQYDKAIVASETLRSVSKPGDELWKHAMLTIARAEGAIAAKQGGSQEHWKAFFSACHTLRANSTRYGDELNLNSWIDYRMTMAKMEMFVTRWEEAAELYGMDRPPFGSGPPECKVLALSDVPNQPQPRGKVELKVEVAEGQADVVAEGAPVLDVLSAITTGMGLKLECTDVAEKTPVFAKLLGVTAEEALETVLGSEGLVGRQDEGAFIVGPMDLSVLSKKDVAGAASLALQQFVVTHPSSFYADEASYALAHVYAVQGDTQLALSQIQLLQKMFPYSSWTQRGHFVAARILEKGKAWADAEREMLAMVDVAKPGDPLVAKGFFWVAQYRVEQGKELEAQAGSVRGRRDDAQEKYNAARQYYEKALSIGIPEAMTAEADYGIAWCMEKQKGTKFSVEAVEDSYRKVIATYRGTTPAEMATYRLARMAFDDAAGPKASDKTAKWEKAVQRYESYLKQYGVKSVQSSAACQDLLQAYLEAGQDGRAAVLAEVIRAATDWQADAEHVLPLLMNAYRKMNMPELGLKAIEEARSKHLPAAILDSLDVAEAELRMQLNNLSDANVVLDRVEKTGTDPRAIQEARLLRAKVCRVKLEYAKAIAICRDVALGPYDDLKVEALKLMGECYEASGEHDKAVWAYRGYCPATAGGSKQ